MKKEKYISLELAKEIAEVAKEKDVDLPESEYFWIDMKFEDESLRFQLGTKIPNGLTESFPAYDCQELGDILRKFKYHISYNGKDFILNVDTIDYPIDHDGHCEMNEDLIVVMARTIIYLLKKDLFQND